MVGQTTCSHYSSASMPDTFTTWNSRPLFLSSTFVDMHDERDLLGVHAFPTLAERLKSRRHYLETVDLRQGIETAGEEDAVKREMKVLQVCLHELERSKPFFLGFLGDRYGWVPPQERMEAATQEAGFEKEVTGSSVTELEMLYAALHESVPFRGWIYLRELDYSGMPDDVRQRFDDRFAGNTESADKLDALKARLKQLHPDRVITYRAEWDAQAGQVVNAIVEEGGEQVPLADHVTASLWQDMAADTEAWLQAAPRNWQEADARTLEEFVEGRIRGFVERESVTQPLIDLALSPTEEGADWGRCLTGNSGSGKSSIFGWVYRDLQNRREQGADLLVLGHAAGIYPRSDSVETLLTRWIHELSLFLQIENPLTEKEESKSPPRPELSREPELGHTSPDNTEQIFASLLGRAALRTRVIVLIDALNQFERSTRGQYLTWLPKLWPDNARLITTAIPGTESQALSEKPGNRVLALQEMTAAEAQQVAHRFYARYRREPPKRALEVLLAKPAEDDPAKLACGNPLWLELALQEMNLLEADDFERADQEFAHLEGGLRIEAIQVARAQSLPATPGGVYWELLGRIERNFGQAHTSAVLSLIALGRAGWRESDLEAMMPRFHEMEWDELAFAGLRRILGHHLVQRGAHAQWDVFHAQLRDSVLARYVYDPTLRQQIHTLIADHLESLPDGDPLCDSEMMVHLIGQGDATRAARYLGRFYFNDPILSQVATLLAQYVGTSEDALTFLTSLPSAHGLTDTEIWRCCSNYLFEIAEAIEEESGLTPIYLLLESCITPLQQIVERDPTGTYQQRDLSVAWSKLSRVQHYRGDLKGAEASAQQALAIATALAVGGEDDKSYLDDVATDWIQLGDLQSEKGNTTEALESYEKAKVILEELVNEDSTNLLWLAHLSMTHSKVGTSLYKYGDNDNAVTAHQQSLKLRESLILLAPNDLEYQRDLNSNFIALGDIEKSNSQLETAFDYYEKARGSIEQITASNPSNTFWQRDLFIIHIKVGSIKKARWQLEEALNHYMQAFEVNEPFER